MGKTKSFAGFAIFAIGILLTACSTNEVFEAGENLKGAEASSSPITGTIYVGGTSRAEESVLDDLLYNGFDAYIYEYVAPADGNGLQPSKVFLGHVDVQKVDNSYTFKILDEYGIAITWDKNQELFIRALYSPTGSLMFGESGDVIYNSDIEFSAAEDILTAKDNKTYSTTTVPTFELSFEHVLSQAAVSVQAPDEKYTYVVDYIEFTNMIPSNDMPVYDFDPAEGGNPWEVGIFERKFPVVGKSEEDTNGRETITSAALVAPFVKEGVGAATIDERFFLIPSAVSDDIPVNSGIRVVYTIYENGTFGIEGTTPVVRLVRTSVNADLNMVRGANRLYRITLPLLPAIGGSFSGEQWATQGGVTVSDLQ